MIAASQLMRKRICCLRAISAKSYSYYITLPEIPDNHVPNIGLMPVQSKFPKFREIKSVGCYFDMGKACMDYEEEIGSVINKIEESDFNISFTEVMDEMDKSMVYLHTIKGLLDTLFMVHQPEFTEKLCKKISNRMEVAVAFPFKSDTLYKYFKKLESSAELSLPEKRIVSSYILTFERDGMHLASDKRDNVLRYQSRLAILMKNYIQCIEAQNMAYSMEIREAQIMEEFPNVIKSLMCDYDTNPQEGPWMFTMHTLLMENFLRYCSNSIMRSSSWVSMVSRCTMYTNPIYSNSTNIEDIRGYRKLLAKFCGKSSYTDYAMKHTMAGTTSNVLEVLKNTAVNVRPVYENEIDSLIELANIRGQLKDFEPCDISYWRRHQLHRIIGVPESDIMLHFPLEHVWSEALSWCSKLLGVSFKDVQLTDKSFVWHENVRMYEIIDNDGSTLGFFYFDPYQRPTKLFNLFSNFLFIPIRPANRTGAMPLSALVGGFSYVGPDNHHLLSFNDVNTLFSSLGRLVQEMVTTHTYSDLHGTKGTEIEMENLSSYFFSNWMRNAEFVKSISKHCVTNQPLPDSLAKSLAHSKTHLAAHDMSYKMMISQIDILLHSTTNFWADIVKETWSQYQPLAYNERNQFVCSFPTIIMGPKQCRFYADLWSEMLAADIYTAFKDSSPEDIPALGLKYRETLLRPGASKTAQDMFIEFKGRDPDYEALSILNNIPPAN